MQNIQSQNTNIYLFPGQGADFRLFKNLEFDSSYTIQYIEYPIPEKKETMQKFASRFVEQIDTNNKFILIGVSLGGMICTELADVLQPEKVIIISSAKTFHELPGRYNFQKKIPLNKIVPKSILKGGARVFAPIVEKDRKQEKETCRDMLKKKHPVYMKRSVDMIINWTRETYNADIVHIHGTSDRTIPIKNVQADYTVDQGSHMMVLTMPEQINPILRKILAD